MKFSEILKNDPGEPPRPPAPQRPSPLSPAAPGPEAAPDSGFRLSASPQGPGPAAPASPAGVFASAAGPAPAAPMARPQPAAASDGDIEALYRGLAPFFERAALGEALPDVEAAGRLLKVKALVEGPDHRLLALSMQDPGCVSPGARGLHLFLFASYLSRGLGLDDAEALTFLVAALAGVPPPPPPGNDPEREREKAEAFKLAADFHGLVHPEPGKPSLRPEQAAASIVQQKPGPYTPGAVRRFINEFSLFPPGSVVRLSSGRLALVREPHAGYPTRPTVQLLDVSDKPDGRGEGLMDLREHPLIRIDTLKDPTKELETVRRRRRRTHMGWNILGF